MKTIKSVLLACSLAMLLASCGSSSYYVSERPAPYVYTRPVAPYNGAIWVEPEYVWRGGSYVAQPGYWSRPRPGYSYHPGQWNHNRRGHIWVRGGWRSYR
ncbi:MAG: hypothetical protein EOP42_09350 [Sphingobacteriaceae bacterium]|nr:MAG: hypothetical protein EOP42_09350 [Sphingobacteriaceae bacterium]